MKMFLRLVVAAFTAQTVLSVSTSAHRSVRSLLSEAEADTISPHIVRIKDVKNPDQLRRSLMTMEAFTDRTAWETAVGGPPSWQAAFPSSGTHSSLAIECGGMAGHEVFTLEQASTFYFINPGVVVLRPVANQVTASMNFTKPVTAWCGDFDIGRAGLGQGLDLDIELVCPGGTVIVEVPSVIGLAFFGIKVADSSDAIEQIVFEGRDETRGTAETFELSGVEAVEAATTTTTTTTTTATTTTDAPPTTVSPPCCTGDPHFMTFNSSEWFDFHGECDLVFLNAPHFANDAGLKIHLRTTARAQFSYIETAAIKIGNSVLQVSSYGDYLLDGISMASMPSAISDFPVTHSVKSEKHHVFHIHLSKGKQIIVQTFKDIVSVKIKGALDPEDYDGSIGMLGEFPGGRWIGRDGVEITQPNDFGNEWQVLDTEDMLFASAREPQFPTQCNMPDPNKKPGRRLGESIALETAHDACAHWGNQKDQCVFDVMATGDMELADAGAF